MEILPRVRIKEFIPIEENFNRHQELPGNVLGEPLICVHRILQTEGTFQPMEDSLFGTFTSNNGVRITVTRNELDF